MIQYKCYHIDFLKKPGIEDYKREFRFLENLDFQLKLQSVNHSFW